MDYLSQSNNPAVQERLLNLSFVRQELIDRVNTPMIEKEISEPVLSVRDHLLRQTVEFKSRKHALSERSSQSHLNTLAHKVVYKSELLPNQNDPSKEDDFVLQQQLTQELSQKAEILKENTLMFHRILEKDKEILQDAERELDQNVSKLEKQRKKLGLLSNSSWTTTLFIWISIIVVILTFIFTFLFMRFFKKKSEA